MINKLLGNRGYSFGIQSNNVCNIRLVEQIPLTTNLLAGKPRVFTQPRDLLGHCFELHASNLAIISLYHIYPLIVSVINQRINPQGFISDP